MKRLGAVVIVVAALGLVPAALAATGLTGHSYQEKVTGFPAKDHLDATWKLQFLPGHIYKVYRNGHFFRKGTDRVSATRITFRTGGGCGSDVGKYAYRFSSAGKKLTFTKISDRCIGRRLILTHGPFHKVS